MDDAPIRRVDDPTIPDPEGLWWPIPPSWIVPDKETGEWRLSSVAFIDRRGELCVELSSLTTAEQSLARYPEHSLAEVKAIVFRERGYGVIPDPLPDNIAHALVSGKITKTHDRPTPRYCRSLLPAPWRPSPWPSPIARGDNLTNLLSLHLHIKPHRNCYRL
jgi:hypothetical protein